MEIIIAGHSAKTLQRLIKRRPNEFDALIITDLDTPFPVGVAELVNDHHWLKFDDVTMTHGSYRAPTIDDVEEGLEWAASKERDKLVVACHAGISRSSAMATLIAYQSNGRDAEKAIAILDPKDHWPNPLVIKHGCAILDAPELWNRYTIFNIEKLRTYDESPCFNLSDMEQEQEHIDL